MEDCENNLLKIQRKGQVKTMGIERISGNSTQIYQNVKPQQNVSKETEAAARAHEQAQQDTPERVRVEPRVDTRPKGGEPEESQLELNQQKTQKVKNAIAEVNRKMNQRTRCEFSYHEETKRVSIKVIDRDTDEVIREIPPEETLDMLSKMWEISGILVDEQR